MSLNDDIREKLAKYTSWFQIVDFNNENTIEAYPPSTGVPETNGAEHCWKCTTINKCFFKDEKDKKPEEFNNANIVILKMFMGIYHPFCECKKLGYNAPKIDEIQLTCLEGKYKDFFAKKLNWYYSWGYRDEDIDLFKNTFEKLVKEAYSKGNYYLRIHDKYGFKINLEITINGINEKSGHFYKVKTGFVIYPNKKLKCNTIIGGKA